MNIKINADKMQEAGFSFDNMGDVYLYISSLIDWLAVHNKNYTKEQYYKIDVIKEVLDCIDCN